MNHHQKTASGASKQVKPSYHGRHLQKHSLAQGYPERANDGPGRKWKQSEIAERGEKIIDLMIRKQETSIIRIEDSPFNSPKMKSSQPEDQTILLQRIAETKQKLQETQQRVTIEQEEAKELDQHLQASRLKYAALLEKKENLSRMAQENRAEEQNEVVPTSQPVLDARIRENQEQLKVMMQDKNELLRDLQSMQAELAFLKRQFKRQQAAEETESTVEDAGEVAMEIQRTKDSIRKIEMDNQALLLKIQEMEHQNTPTEILYRKFIELYEEVFIEKELEKVQRLFQAKEKEFRRQQQFQRNKSLLKEKKKELQSRQKKVQQRMRQQKKLQHQVVIKSSKLLEVFQYDT